MKHILRASALVVLVACGAWAGSANSSMTVSANVSNNCVISAGALAFSAYDPVAANASTALTGTATLTLTCTNGASTTITLDQGTWAANGSTNAAPLRQLKGGAGSDYLSYTLTQDNAGSTPWGNTGGTGASYSGTGSQQTVTVYGSVASGQSSAHAGSYSDSVQVTITF